MNERDLEKLLRKTVDPSHDIGAIRGLPFVPMHLMFVSFFGGILAGGLLFSLNAQRLGWRRRWMLMALYSVLLWAGLLFFRIKYPDSLKIGDSSVDFILVRAVALLSMLPFYREQTRRMQAHLIRGGQTESPLIATVVAIGGFLADQYLIHGISR